MARDHSADIDRLSASELQQLYGRYAKLGVFDFLMGFTFVGRSSRRKLVSALDLHPGDRVLDLACGTGLGFKALLSALGPEGSIVGVDLTAAMLARAEQRVEHRQWANIELIRADAARLPFEDDSFSAVCSTLALSLVPDWRRAIDECWRVLRPGGRLGLIDVAPLSGWRSVIAPFFNQANHRLAGWKPPGPDLIGTFSALSPSTGMHRLPPLGVWMLLWVEKLPDRADASVDDPSSADSSGDPRAERLPAPRLTGHV
jgi:SAM-dependent methyltransferase